MQAQKAESKISKSQNILPWSRKTSMQANQNASRRHACRHKKQNPKSKSRIQNPDTEGGIVGFRSDSWDDPGIRDAPSCLHGAAELQKVFVHVCKIVRPLDSARRPAKSRIKIRIQNRSVAGARILRGECKTQNIVMGGRWKLQIVRAECKTENVLSEPSKEVSKMSKYARSESKL